MSYPIPDLGQRPHLPAELDELGQPSPARSELDELGQPSPARPEFDEPGQPSPASPEHRRLGTTGRPLPSRARAQRADRRCVVAPGLLGLIPPPARLGEPDRLRDRELDSSIADRAAREAYAEWVVGSVCRV